MNSSLYEASVSLTGGIIPPQMVVGRCPGLATRGEKPWRIVLKMSVSHTIACETGSCQAHVLCFGHAQQGVSWRLGGLGAEVSEHSVKMSVDNFTVGAIF